MIKRIIFDIDNTLLASYKDTNVAYKKYIKDTNISKSPEDIYYVLESYLNKDIQHNYETLLDFIKENLFSEFTKEKLLEFMNYYKSESTLEEKCVPEVLEYLSDKYELVALTNWFQKEQIYRMKSQNLDKYFSEINGFDSLGAKPFEETFKKACYPYNYDECVIIGDSIENDIKVPHKLGMKSILLSKEYKEGKYKSIKSLNELMDIL